MQRRARLGSLFSNPSYFPYGIYTIPEISFIGKTEEQLTEEDVPYEVGVAYYREIARGQIRGDTTGRLKLIFHRETLELLGVHIIGEGASELLHIGQAVMILKGTMDYFVDTVFNYPTLAECYKAAAFNGLNKLSARLNSGSTWHMASELSSRTGSQWLLVRDNACGGIFAAFTRSDASISDSLYGVRRRRLFSA